MEKNKLSSNSSILVSVPALIVWALLMLITAAVGYLLLSGIFLFLLLLCAFVRYWSARAMDGVGLEISCRLNRLYPGTDTRIEYLLKNDKLLPLVWLELSQQKPDKDCIIPDSGFEEYKYYGEADSDAGEQEEISAYRRSFSMVMSYETISVSTLWHAQCRGIYRPGELLLRSGDGFGLSQVEKRCLPEHVPEIVVYPRRVPVNEELFLRMDWDSAFGAAGHKEDMTVLRGLRPYTGSESWKRINWRMAARQTDSLQVNLYETVQPASAIFILDGESYCEAPEELERSLEIIASLVAALSSKSVSCGLCLPGSKSFSAINIPPSSQAEASELMYRLSGYECIKKEIRDKEGRPTGRFVPSKFAYTELRRAIGDAGFVALITHDAAALPPRLVETLESSRLGVFSSGALACPWADIRVQHISVLERGDAL